MDQAVAFDFAQAKSLLSLANLALFGLKIMSPIPQISLMIPEETANMFLTFCQMETYLLRKQIEALKKKFVEEGGFRENLFKQRQKQLQNSP